MFRRLGASIRKWMYGRYGSDQLNMLLLVLAVILSLTNTILTYALRTSTVYRGIIAPILSLLMYGLLILAMVRMFSRNLSRRERENRRFLQLWIRLRDRNNRYFRCPSCGQTVRVPKHRCVSAARNAARNSSVRPSPKPAASRCGFLLPITGAGHAGNGKLKTKSGKLSQGRQRSVVGERHASPQTVKKPAQPKVSEGRKV